MTLSSRFKKLFALAFFLIPVCAAQVIGQRADMVSFSFSAYGNPQRPFPGYVGPYQLGPVRIQGSGTINRRTGALVSGGQITHTDNLLSNRYPNHVTTWQIVRSLGLQSSGGVTVLRLSVQVTGSNYTRICPVGTYGILELVDDNRLMQNRQTYDSVRTEMPNPSRVNLEGTAACGTHTHGMNNANYSWTDPPFGGMSGGIWANVQISVPQRQNIQITQVDYPRQIRGDGTRYNMTVYWRGDATPPVRLVLAPRTCPAGLNCITETRSFNVLTNPFIGSGVVWCQLNQPMVFNADYYVTPAGRGAIQS